MSGFTFVRSMSNAGVAGKLERYHVDAAHATRLAAGDVVASTGTSHTDGVNECDAWSSGAMLGVISAVEPLIEGEQLSETSLPASTAGYVLVNIDPLAIYEADADVTLVEANVGLNLNVNATAATKSGNMARSNMTLDQSTLATTATHIFRVHKLVENASGTLGGRAQVVVNNHEFKAGAVGK